jgi:replication-associated recombination protein RarA
MRMGWQLVPRLYGPGHFTEDPYSHVVSPHGIPVDDLVSVLQKEIRRGRVDNAVLAAYEMFTTSADVAQHLWRRLRVIAVEDVGMGLPLGPVLIDVLHRDFNATPGGEWMVACHAVRLLASAPKDRTSSEHADWVAVKVALGEVPRGADRDPPPRRSGERDRASPVLLRQETREPGMAPLQRFEVGETR